MPSNKVWWIYPIPISPLHPASPLDRTLANLIDRAFNGLTLDTLAAGSWRPLRGRKAELPQVRKLLPGRFRCVCLCSPNLVVKGGRGGVADRLALVRDEGLDANVSVKLSAFGIRFDPAHEGEWRLSAPAHKGK